MYTNLNELEQGFKDEKAWGISTTIDLKKCHGIKIKSKHSIAQFVKILCENMRMNTYGDPKIIHFGKDLKVAGYSFAQFIETSLVSGHFSDMDQAAYIDIFSCKVYDPWEALNFSQDYFEAKEGNMNFYLRK